MQQVSGLNEAIPSRDPGHVPKMQPSTMASRMQKEVRAHYKYNQKAPEFNRFSSITHT